MAKIAELFQKNRAVILYLFFGVVTTIINIVVYWLFADVWHVNYMVSNVFAWIASVLVAYFTNRKWVFTPSQDGVMREMTRFFSARLATLALDMAVMWLMVDVLTANNLLAKVVANVLVVISNYILSKVAVFGK